MLLARMDPGQASEGASAEVREEVREEMRESVGLSVAYYGETFTHPGLVAAAVFMPVHDARLRHALVVAPELGWYIHPRNHHALFAGAQVGYRFRADRRAPGFVFQLQAGVAYQRSFVRGPVYTLGEDGTIAMQRDRGRSTIKPSGALGFGYDLSARGGIPLEPFLRVEAHGRYPFNDYALFGFAAQVGAIYRFSLPEGRR